MAEFSAIGPIDGVYEIAKFLEGRGSTFADRYINQNKADIILDGSSNFQAESLDGVFSYHLAIYSDEWAVQMPSIKQIANEYGVERYFLTPTNGPYLSWIIHFDLSRTLVISEIWYQSSYLVGEEVFSPSDNLKFVFTETRKLLQRMNYRYLAIRKGGRRHLVYKPLHENIKQLYKNFYPRFGDELEPEEDWNK